jgi:5-methylthioadenosine/S-adenosylhomocysteine deaminase
MHALVNGRVMDAMSDAPRAATVLVESGRIEALLPPDATVPLDAERFDATDRLIIPGLVNAHTHGHGNLMKGVGDRWTLEISLVNGPWASGRRDPEQKYLSALAGAVEMLAKGVTACYDLVYEHPVPSVEGLQAIAQAYHDAGIRAVVCPMIADRSFYEAIPGLADSLPADLAAEVRAFRMAPVEETLAAVETVMREWRLPRDQVAPAVAPTIPMHCSETLIRRCIELAEEHGTGIQMHLAESKVQVEAAARSYGKTLAQYVDQVGLAGPRFAAAHAIWLDADDYKRLADKGCQFIHVPGSNYRLGSGIAPVRMMLDAGATVALATDGATSSDNLNVFEVMRLAAMSSRVFGEPHERWLTSREVFAMATLGGARVLGREGRAGRVEPGFDADFTVMDLTGFNYLPLNDALNQIVNCEDGTGVSDVMVAGRWVVRDRKVLTTDVGRLRSRLQAAADAARETAAPIQQQVARLAPHVAAFARRLIEHPNPVNRYVRG